MKFKIITALDNKITKGIHDSNLPQYVSKFISSKVDSEDIYSAIVETDTIKQIQELGYYFDDDIVIWGADMDNISPKKTIEELGLL